MKQLNTGNSNLSKLHHEVVLSIIKSHFHQSPILCQFLKQKTNEEIREYFVRHVRETLANSVYAEVLVYLEQNWYSKSTFCLWGWNFLGELLPLTKTTMAVEAHWSLLKRKFLGCHNRPRIDMLFFIIDGQVIPNYINSFQLILQGRVKPDWWRDFVKERKILNTRPTHGEHDVNLSSWTCTCPAFTMYRFFCVSTL